MIKILFDYPAYFIAISPFIWAVISTAWELAMGEHFRATESFYSHPSISGKVIQMWGNDGEGIEDPREMQEERYSFQGELIGAL
jgi:hypothetical protein